MGILKCSIMGVRGRKLSRIIRSPGVKCLRGPPILTPRGYIPISVGVNDETKKFMIHTKVLSDAEFLEFLCRSAEEYGFCNEGILRIPYEAKAFEEWMIKGAKQKMLIKGLDQPSHWTTSSAFVSCGFQHSHCL